MQIRKNAIFVLFLAMVLALSGCGKKSEPQTGNSRVNEQKENTASTTLVSGDGQVATNSLETVQTGINTEETATSSGETATSPGEATSSFSEEADTSNWKTYRNEEYGFEIRYPVGWKAGEDNEILADGKKQKVVIIHNPKDENCSVNILIKKEDYCIERIPDLPSVTSLDNISIDGYKTSVAYKEYDMGQWFYRFFVKIKNKDLQFRFVPSGHSRKEILYKILSTVKFYK